MSKEEGCEFMKEGWIIEKRIPYTNLKALSRAMARDGSSGGVVRLAAITASGVERFVYTGKEIPLSNLA